MSSALPSGGRAKVRRYQAGKVPDFATESGMRGSESESDGEEDIAFEKTTKALAGNGDGKGSLSRREDAAADAEAASMVVSRGEVNDRRLRRLMGAQETGESWSDRHARHRQRHAADDDDDSADDAPPHRHGRLRGGEEEEEGREHDGGAAVVVRSRLRGQEESSDAAVVIRRRANDDGVAGATAAVAPDTLDEDDEEDDELALARRRARARQLAAECKDEEEKELFAMVGRHKRRGGGNDNEKDGGNENGDGGDDEEEDDDDESDEDDSDESESSSEEEEEIRLKPVFIRKDQRVTIREAEEEEKQALEREEALVEKLVERKEESRALVETVLRREDEEKDATAPNVIDDTDDADEELAFEAWKVRELTRIKREREEREAFEREAEDIERRRGMTAEELARDDEERGRVVTNEAEKGAMSYMQKWYHRGAYYLDEDAEVLKRNVNEPTLEDKVDKTALPKVMQVKNFGRAGRTKYTHLLDQDTSRGQQSPWFQGEVARHRSAAGGGASASGANASAVRSRRRDDDNDEGSRAKRSRNV